MPTPAAAENTPPGPTPPEGVRRILDRWHSGECYLAVASFTLIAALLLMDVIGREFIGPVLHKLGLYSGPTGIFGSQRISVYALIIGSFAGIGIATATGSHLVPRVGFGWIPERFAPTIDRVADVITAVVLLGIAWYGVQFVLSSKLTDLRAPVLDWPTWPFQLAIPLGFASAALRYLCYAAWPALRPVPPEFQE